MFNGTPIVERVKRLIERQMSLLESWATADVAPGLAQGLSPDQLAQLKTIAMIARQLDLDNVEASVLPSRVDNDSSVEDLLAAIPSKK